MSESQAAVVPGLRQGPPPRVLEQGPRHGGAFLVGRGGLEPPTLGLRVAHFQGFFNILGASEFVRVASDRVRIAGFGTRFWRLGDRGRGCRVCSQSFDLAMPSPAARAKQPWIASAGERLRLAGGSARSDRADGVCRLIQIGRRRPAATLVADVAHQPLRCTTSSKGRRFKRVPGLSGRSAGYPRSITNATSLLSGTRSTDLARS
jgi:hypothetical protein